MADKPKLKETDEILDSIGKGGRKRQPSILTGELPQQQNVPTEPAEAAGEEPLISSQLDSPPARRTRRARGTPPQGQDRNPLDFDKYKLTQQPDTEQPAPKRRGRPPKAAQQQEEAAAQEKNAPKRRGRPPKAAQPPLPQREEAPEQRVYDAPPQNARERTPIIREYAFEHFPSGDLPGETPSHVPEAENRPQAAAEPEQAPEQPKAPGRAAASTAAGRRRKLPKKVAEAPQKPILPEEQPESLLPDRESQRESFLRRLSTQFEQEFSQRFEGVEPERSSRHSANVAEWLDSSRPAKRKGEPPAPALPDDPFAAQEPEPAAPSLELSKSADSLLLMPEEEIEAKREAEQFLLEFEQSVKEEEQIRAETFKETLADKFQRERERYLKELGINPEEPLPPEPDDDMDPFTPTPEPELQEPQHPPRRRLDLQIQPELHKPDEPLPPMTYGRDGAAQIQTDSEEPLPYIPGTARATTVTKGAPGTVVPAARAKRTAAAKPVRKEPEQTGPKSGEQLLLELGVQQSLRGMQNVFSVAEQAQEPPARPFAPELAPSAQMLVRQEEEKKERGLPLLEKIKGKFSRTVLLSGAAALLALVVIGAAVLSRLDLKPSDNPEADETGITLSPDTLTVYESRNPAETLRVQDLLVKRAGISLSNIEVENNLVIQDIETPGEVLLSDMTVGGSIFVRGCAVDMLRLSNVAADRIVVNNSQTRVGIQATGRIEVDTVELRTPATLQEHGLEPDVQGVATVLMNKSKEADMLDATLGGVSLTSLTAIGDSAVALADGSSIEQVNAEGNLSMTGDGRVGSLFLSTPDGANQAAVSLKSVEVSNISLKAPADVSVAARVDTLTTENSLNLGGGGVVGTMLLNKGVSGGRIPIELSDVNVQTMISNAEARVNVSGNSALNALIANESVYVLGNKVNHLTVKANNVIYQNEPDKITTANGVRPPGSVAEYPNIDFSLTASENDTPTDVTADGVATTCNHNREAGGFVRGDGSIDNPFEVSTAAQLAHVGSHLGSHFVQTADIDIAEDSAYAGGFPVLAGDGTPFSGTYDGGGHTIANLRVEGNGESIALFAENTGTIKNMHIISGDVKSASSARTYTAGLVGMNYQGGLVLSCSNGARVTASQMGYAGGIVAYNYGDRAIVRDCYNYAKISGSANIGGLVGVNRDGASIVNSYNVGTIEATTDYGSLVGINANAAIANSYYLADTAPSGVGSGSGNVVERSSDEMKSRQMLLDLTAGSTDTNWTMPTSGSYTYPILARSIAASASGGTSDSGVSQYQPPPPIPDNLSDDLSDIAEDDAPPAPTTPG